MDYTYILINIRKIIRSVNLEDKRIEKEYGISIPQLLCLNYHNGKTNFQASHKEIKDFLQLNASTVTGIIARLEKKGLLARLPKQNDKRVGLVTLTVQCAELLKNSPEPLHETLTLKLKSLPPEKLKELQQAFDKIINFLDIDNTDAAPILSAADFYPTDI